MSWAVSICRSPAKLTRPLSRRAAGVYLASGMLAAIALSTSNSEAFATPPRQTEAVKASTETTSAPSGTAQFKSPPHVGKIQLLPGPSPMHEGKILPLLYTGGIGQGDQSITAGELWSFFQHQGLEKVESIVLFLDVNKFEDPASITVKSIEFRIETANSNLPVTSCSLSESNPLIIPGYDSLAHLPEARLEIPLEFDFMQRFSAESPDQVYLKIIYDAPAGNAPNLFVAGQQQWITLPSFSLLFGFIAFWGVVFYTLARLTLKSVPAPANDRRVS